MVKNTTIRVTLGTASPCRLSSVARCPPRRQRGRHFRPRDAVIRAGRTSGLTPTPVASPLQTVNQVAPLHLGKGSRCVSSASARLPAIRARREHAAVGTGPLSHFERRTEAVHGRPYRRPPRRAARCRGAAGDEGAPRGLFDRGPRSDPAVQRTIDVFRHGLRESQLSRWSGHDGLPVGGSALGTSPRSCRRGSFA